MGSRTFRSILGVGLVSVSGAFVTTGNSHDFLLRSRHRACDLGKIQGHGYRADRVLESQRIVAAATDVSTTTVVRYPTATMDRDREPVLRKQFFIERLAFPVGDVQLDQLALAVYSDGQINCTGRLASIGTAPQPRVRIRVRALSSEHDGTSNFDSGLEVWSTEKITSIRRSEPRNIHLVGSLTSGTSASGIAERDATASVQLASHLTYQRFEEITHLEITLERLTQY